MVERDGVPEDLQQKVTSAIDDDGKGEQPAAKSGAAAQTGQEPQAALANNVPVPDEKIPDQLVVVGFLHDEILYVPKKGEGGVGFYAAGSQPINSYRLRSDLEQEGLEMLETVRQGSRAAKELPELKKRLEELLCAKPQTEVRPLVTVMLEGVAYDVPIGQEKTLQDSFSTLKSEYEQARQQLKDAQVGLETQKKQWDDGQAALRKEFSDAKAAHNTAVTRLELELESARGELQAYKNMRLAADAAAMSQPVVLAQPQAPAPQGPAAPQVPATTYAYRPGLFASTTVHYDGRDVTGYPVGNQFLDSKTGKPAELPPEIAAGAIKYHNAKGKPKKTSKT